MSSPAERPGERLAVPDGVHRPSTPPTALRAGYVGRLRSMGQICMPRGVGGWRGAGLGNEIFPWAKAYLASRELGFGLVQPAWGLNPRGYWREFGTPRLDWLAHGALTTVMPVVRVTDEMVRSTGQTDYGAAVRILDAEHGWSQRRSLVLLHEGMSGGYLGIERARDFLRNRLLGHLPDAEAGGRAPGDARLHVAVHARLGDFRDDSVGPRPGTFNARVPAAWYRSLLNTLQAQYGPALRVDIVSDDFGQAARMLPEWSGPERPRTTLEDLSVMVAADLLICSVSSLSMLAAFLSDGPYLWFRPHLGDRSGFLSIWGHEDGQRTGPTAAHIQAEQLVAADPLPTRGVAMGADEELPLWLKDFLQSRAAFRRRSADLIHYGVVHGGSGLRAES